MDEEALKRGLLTAGAATGLVIGLSLLATGAAATALGYWHLSKCEDLPPALRPWHCGVHQPSITWDFPTDAQVAAARAAAAAPQPQREVRMVAGLVGTPAFPAPSPAWGRQPTPDEIQTVVRRAA